MAELQIGMDFGEPERPADLLFDPAMIRSEALDLIAGARANTADEHWDVDKLRFNRILFPHLVSWLPDADERAQLCFDFTRELDRIELLLAA